MDGAGATAGAGTVGTGLAWGRAGVIVRSQGCIVLARGGRCTHVHTSGMGQQAAKDGSLTCVIFFLRRPSAIADPEFACKINTGGQDTKSA